MANDRVVVKQEIRQQFYRFVEYGRVLFFSAPYGFGKSTVADALLFKRKVLRLSAADPAFALPNVNGAWEFLLIDDLQSMQEESDWLALCELIRGSPDRRFILLSRGAPHADLMAFQYSGLMTVLDADSLLFDRDDVRTLFQTYGIDAADSEIGAISEKTSGYPLGVVIAANLMAAGKPIGPELAAQGLREVFLYFESSVYRRFDLPIRRFLLELAPFEHFDPEMARMVSGDTRAGERLEWLRRNTTMLRYDGANRFHFWPVFRKFLLWEMEREYTEEKRRSLFSRGGLYYELKEDYPHALECYAMGGDHSKISELLIRNAELHPGMGHYGELESYYRALPESEVRASPSLMQGMSMLCALATDYAGSERWYHELEHFAENCGKSDAAAKQARSRLAWLDISLPQRSVADLTETIPAVFRLMVNREVALPPVSVTSTLPSILNGGKDLSEWSRKDDLLYKTLRAPAEMVLGRDGVGLADCALAESKFEKGEDVSSRMLAIVSRMGEIRQKGTLDIEFAAAGLLARSQLSSGRPDDARRTLEMLRLRFTEDGQTRFLPNLDAMLCRVSLYTGDLDAADMWYREKAPRDPLHIQVMKRYQYLTQAMVELANGQNDAALVTLAPLEPYCEACARHIDGIHLHLLSAIALNRKKDHAWREHLTRALKKAEEFRYIRPVSGYGAALLPLLDEVPPDADAKWSKRLIHDVRLQASFYSRFLQPRLQPNEALTEAELQVLRLVCADKSNAEIGQMLDIKLSTVKTHVSHILDKLGVSRRSEAKTAARKLWLIPDET